MQRLRFNSITQNLWFTSDLHLGHKNAAGPNCSVWKSGYRNFDNVDQMNDTIISNINEKVGINDILFILGDFSFNKNPEYFRNKIICKNIYLVLGNHDREIRRKEKFRALFTQVFDFGVEIYIDNELVTLNHYSMQVWAQSHRGAIHLFGHSHNKIKAIGKSMDVGVDTNDCKPYSWSDITNKLNVAEIEFKDGYNENTD